MGPADGSRASTNDAPAVAAAVCYRIRDDLELLVVRTGSGRGWTFPKGHVDPAEHPADAAAREALEEAGVVVEVERETPLGVYAYEYAAAEALEGRAGVVVAYLARAVDAPASSCEPGRSPLWAGPDEVVRRLAQGREPRFAAEHERVVATAEAAVRERLGREHGAAARGDDGGGGA